MPSLFYQQSIRTPSTFSQISSGIHQHSFRITSNYHLASAAVPQISSTFYPCSFKVPSTSLPHSMKNQSNYNLASALVHQLSISIKSPSEILQNSSRISSNYHLASAPAPQTPSKFHHTLHQVGFHDWLCNPWCTSTQVVMLGAFMLTGIV